MAREPAAKPSAGPFERVEMLEGPPYLGYVESQDDLSVDFIQICRPRGRAEYLVIRTIDRRKVAAVVGLDERQRVQLQQQIEQVRNRAWIEIGHMEAVRLEPHSRDGVRYQCYRGKSFSLESTADDSTTRRMIVRIEPIFTAYRQVLPPRVEPQRPLRVVVLGSMAEYRAYLERLGIEIQNPACFIQRENLVVAGSDLDRFALELAKVKAQHARLEDVLRELEKQVPARLAEIARQMQADGVMQDQIAKALRNKRREFDEEIARKRSELQAINRENDRKFHLATDAMFSRLYHEAFHAYMENCVYPSKTHDVPPWLNEGLARLFEAGMLDADTLRIDAPHRESLNRLKADLSGRQSLPLERVLAADQQAFLAGGDANRLYAHSWGLAYYLTFEKHVLGTPALNQYVQPQAKALAPVLRFQDLTRVPTARFEQTWREYILNLR